MRILSWLVAASLATWATVQVFGTDSDSPTPTLGFRALLPETLPASTAVHVPPTGLEQSPGTTEPSGGVAPRVSLRHDIGDGVGYRNGFTYIEGFLPLTQVVDRQVLFANFRVVNFDDARLFEYNAGGGFRWVNAFTDRILGVNAFYDGRQTRTTFFNQAGIGAESLGPFVDMRCNVYLPFGSARQQVLDTGFVNPQFVASNIAFDRTQAFDVAMRGLELEAGGALPGLQRFDARAFLGYYHYEGGGMPSVDGVRGRMEAMLGRHASLHLAVQNDRTFDTTVSGGVALHWGGSRTALGTRTRTEALGQRVVRDVNIVMATDVQTTKEMALDPATGQPFVVKHASSNAGDNGDGTVERPFKTLAQLEAGSSPGNILLAHGGSVFSAQGIVLQAGQRFLGEGVDHTLRSTRGAMLLPRVTSGTASPIIADSPRRAIVLASNTEVSGLVISNPARSGIFGKEISNINVNRNTILSPDRSGIRLADVSGQVYLGYNTISDGDQHGIKFVNKNSTSVNATIVGNNFTNIAPCGCYDPIHIDLRDFATWNGVIANNHIDLAGGFGIAISASDNAVAIASITRNSITNIGAVGIYLERKQSATARFQVAYNVLDNLGALGVLADSTNKKSMMAMQVIGNSSSAPIMLNAAAKSNNFFYEDDGSNIFTGGAFLTASPEAVLMPTGSLGFPSP